DEDEISKSSVEVTMMTKSIDTGSVTRDRQLRSASFLNSDSYPSIRFKSLQVGPGKDRDMLSIRGELTIRDKSREVVLNVTEVDRSRSPQGDEVVYYVAETTINRFDFGVKGWRGVAGSTLKVVINVEDTGMSVDELKDFQERSGVFDQISAVWSVDANLTGSDRPQRIELLAVSPNYFSLLGASAQLGRVFGPQDHAQGFAEGVVISDGMWRRSFAADPNVLGRKIYVDTDLYTVIGVMPAGFRHPGKTLRNEVDAWGTAGFT